MHTKEKLARCCSHGVSQAISVMLILMMMECLIWNVPNDHFGFDTWSVDLRNCMAYLFNQTLNPADCSDWGEVSELKFLFAPGQPWTDQSAHRFISDCWNYVGFE